MKKNKGFTLIELLVVISIVGLLSSLLLVNTSKIRVRGRDARRIQDMQTISNALELYYADHGTYPAICCGSWFVSPGSGSDWTNFENELRPYIEKLPQDPSGKMWSYLYANNNPPTGCFVMPDGWNKNIVIPADGYFIFATLEDKRSPLANAFYIGPPTQSNYMIYGGNVKFVDSGCS